MMKENFPLTFWLLLHHFSQRIPSPLLFRRGAPLCILIRTVLFGAFSNLPYLRQGMVEHTEVY